MTIRKRLAHSNIAMLVIPLLTAEHIFVPNAWNDFIFAYLANVLGFVGAAAVLALLDGVAQDETSRTRYLWTICAKEG